MNTPTNAAMRPSERDAKIAAALALVAQDYSAGCTATPREYVENAVAQLIDAGYSRELDAAQPAQAGEAVGKTRHDGSVQWFAEFTIPPATKLYLHPQPEQPASAEQDALRELVTAGNALSFAAQLTGGVAGRDEALVAAIDAWTKARDAAAVSPAVSPPSVVAVAPKVAVSDEDVEQWDRDVEKAARAIREIANPKCVSEIACIEFAEAALESFAQRIAGSGERDAVDAARYRWLRCQGNREHAARLLTDRMNVDEALTQPSPNRTSGVEREC
jgi:hypothetical protein